jgi:hypothetical protein
MTTTNITSTDPKIAATERLYATTPVGAEYTVVASDQLYLPTF